ncbi:MAG TPA: pitrilysin family protein [Planctomycetota bacterium]|nr:pitrilysin family protein [Planctomycetota bacterium]
MTPPLVLTALLAMTPTQTQGDLHVPFFKTTLENGLEVVIHEDHTDPVVAVYLSYHVGSGREESGRSGFAHLFEHMLFQGSAHVGDDQHFKYVSEAGGNLNGTTNRDRTLYYETLPANQLELALWLEADRMGFLLPAVTQEKLDNQRDVVRNERRQNYENRPYGQGAGAIAAAMFPPGHPYSWLTIGSHADLEAASLEDVHAFFRRWYGPNNATLAIGGDIEREAALALVQKYFGPIARGPQVAAPRPQPARLEAEVRLVLEDQVQLPQLDLAWPGTTHYSGDDAALDMLARVLSASKSSVLDRALTVERQLASRVSASNGSGELAGTFEITVRAAPGVDLDTLEHEVRRLLAELDRKGVDPAVLARLKTDYEASFVRRLETVAAKTSALAQYNTFLGDPAGFQRELDARLSVTADEVLSVLRRYVLGKPCVVLSTVPAGRRALAASGRTPAQIAAEASFDRAQPPAAGPRPNFASPVLWTLDLGKGLRVTGTPLSELPLTSISIALPAGRLAERPEQLGLSSLTAQMMDEGTTELDTLALADALEGLGAGLNVRSDDDELTVSLTVLDKHLEAALELAADVLLEPRFAPEDFERLVLQRLSAIDTRGDNIRGVTGTVWDRLMYGSDTVLGLPSAGTRASVEALSVEDVRAFHARAIAAGGARISVVSSRDEAGVRAALAGLAARWPAGGRPVEASVSLGAFGEDDPRSGVQLFLVDKPGAAQSEIRIGHMGVSSLDPDHWPLTVLNYVLGGAFSSRVNMNLREDKGYTYGARTSFGGGLRPAPFTASAGVKSDVTAESVAEFLKELRAIRDGVTAEELAFAKSALTQQQLPRYESSRARLGWVDTISTYGWPADFVERQLAELDELTEERMRELAREYVHPDAVTILVVGDKSVVLEGLEGLGLGPVTELDIDGLPLD